MLLASATEIMPSLPTLAIASAIIIPMSSSLLAEIVAICLISCGVLIALAKPVSSFKIRSTALSIPFLILIGLAPAVTFFTPSAKIASAKTIAVVVPSPAISAVLEATSLTSCAPIFSNLSFRTISLATVTPSFVERGEPKLFLMTTLRPLGPRVTFTVRASFLTPSRIDLKASCSNCKSLVMIQIPFS